MVRNFVFIFIASLPVGCSGITYLGKVGEVDFFSVHAEHFTGPNSTSLVTETGGKDVEGEDGKITHVSGRVRIEKTAFFTPSRNFLTTNFYFITIKLTLQY